tara:strand:- start:763 stop:1644 length:882 start_codon:yes stop_codon:yes gene_type:complete
MVDGVVDEFEDETGVDNGTSANESYDATNDYYENPGADALYDVSGQTAAGRVSNINVEARAWDNNTDVAGGSGVIWSPDGTAFAIGVDHGEDISVTKMVIYPPNDTGCWGGTSGELHAYLEGSADGSTWVNLGGNANRAWPLTAGLAIQTITPTNLTAYQYHRLSWIKTAGGAGYARLAEVEFYQAGTVPNVTLVSNATTALAVPTSVFTVIHHETVDSVTLNTDLLVYASRNGGSNWTAGTLAVETALSGNEQILSATVDVSGQPSGVAMKWKIVTANNKSQRIRAISQQWS